MLLEPTEEGILMHGRDWRGGRKPVPVTILSYKKEPLVSTNIEEKADEILKEADLDLDKKLSLKEFKSKKRRFR